MHHPYSIIFFTGSYPNLTEEYKKSIELQKYLNKCVDLALFENAKRVLLIKRLKATYNELLNWTRPMDNNNVREDNASKGS